MSPAKRAFDIVASTAGLAVLSPFLALAIVAIKLDSKGPAFFRQVRIGRGGKPFSIWKFRTMVADAPKAGGALTVGRDPRITRVGHWLRRTKLDELPQLINVVVGEMSLVGPRPEVPKYVGVYDENARRVLALAPGITDPASIAFRSESELLGQSDDPERLYIERIMPEKIRINLDYAARAGFFSDLGVIFQTIFGREGPPPITIGGESTKSDARPGT